MDEDNERKDEDIPEEWVDKTKDDFFSDLLEMEDQLDEEAYERVEHAISLIDSKFYDDAIEVLRQAIGVYSQINRTEEIDAIRSKIDEVYVLKEEAFKEVDVQPEEVADDAGYNASILIEEANQLIEIDEFDEAIERYDEALRILNVTNNVSEIERVNGLIEECYDLKMTFLQKAKVEVAPVEPDVEEEEATLDEVEDEVEPISEEALKEQKLKDFEAEKQYDEEVSNYALELLGQASDLANQNQYDEAIQLYEESMTFFKEIGWVNEVQKVEATISQLNKQKEKYLGDLEKQRELKEKKIEEKEEKAAILEEKAAELEKQKELERMHKLRQAEAKKMEQKAFEMLISNMVDQAEKMAR